MVALDEEGLFDGPYDFNEKSYHLITPLALDKGDRVRVECTHRNTTSETVTFSGDRVQLTASEKTPCKDHADDNCEVKVPLAFTPKQAGVASFEGVLSFSVCSEEKCLTPKETLTMKVDVQ